MTETEKLIVTLEARIADFEHALEHRFKPALRKAITDVFDEFAKELDEFVKVEAKPDTRLREVMPTPEQRERLEAHVRDAIRNAWDAAK